MKTVKLLSQKRSGLFAEHSAGIAPVVYEARATIPVVEALQASGASVVPLQLPRIGYTITLGDKMPVGIVAVHLNGSSPQIALRLDDEPEYPMEHPEYWSTVDFTPCPVCAAPVIWYEAGYVPGYRVCTRKPHHHSLAK